MIWYDMIYYIILYYIILYYIILYYIILYYIILYYIILYYIILYMICFLTAIELTPGGSNTAHIYTQTMHRTTQNKQYIAQHKNLCKSAGRAPSLRVIHLHLPYNWGKSTENLSQSSRRVPVGTMKIHKHTIRIHKNDNKNTMWELHVLQQLPAICLSAN